ncbi:MAG: hypothetical protein ACFFG0_02810 [Candidatus Thorarchaeota archaeon]
MGYTAHFVRPNKSFGFTSHIPNIMPNSSGKLHGIEKLNFKSCSTEYNTFTIPKHLNSRMY